MSRKADELTDVQLVWEAQRFEQEVKPRMEAILADPNSSRREKKHARKWLKLWPEMTETVEALRVVREAKP